MALLALLPASAVHAAAAPALYTQQQAQAGAAKYADNCEQCHGAQLEGRAGPALRGPAFAPPSANLTVGEIFTMVSQQMPASNPGSLDRQDYVEIIAYLLQQNGYPAGPQALDTASKAPLVYQGK